MKHYILVIFLIMNLFVLSGYDNRKSNQTNNIVNENGATIIDRFTPPTNFTRIIVDINSFANYLRNLPLKTFGSAVLYFNKSPKINSNIYISVINMDIDPLDLQQCADAVIRLRAEYLFAKNAYKNIHFNFVSDGKPRYFEQYSKGDNSYSIFRKYLKYIFSYANTSSLKDELIPVKIDSMQIGDVFIQKGKPYGHAVIVVDMAIDPKTGNKIFMLAQSFMPAQDIHILVNRENSYISPWYELNSEKFITPEWIFNPSDLRRFRD